MSKLFFHLNARHKATMCEASMLMILLCFVSVVVVDDDASFAATANTYMHIYVCIHMHIWAQLLFMLSNNIY